MKKSPRTTILVFMFCAMLLPCRPVSAGVIQIGSQAALEALGTIVQTTTFDSFGTLYSYPGSPYTVGDLSFVAGGENLVVGTGTGYSPVRNILTDNYPFAGTTVVVANTYDLFAFNVGALSNAGNNLFTVTTNLSTYAFLLSVSNASQSLTFIGFQAGPGEYFTSVAWSGSASVPYTVGATDVQVGTAVPEPVTLLLFGTGLAAAGNRRRLKKRR
jgi:hypothetical protein